MADLDPAAEHKQPSASLGSLAGREPAAERTPPVTRSLAAIEAEGGTEYELKLLLKPSTAANMGACPFPMELVDSENLKSEYDSKVFFITFNKQYHPEHQEDLLEWFAEVIKPKAEEPNSSESKADEVKVAQPEPGERQEQAAKTDEPASSGEAVKKGEPAKGEPAEDIPGHRDILVFPSTLNKHQRALWHQMAVKHGLASGFGEDRVLTMTLPEGKPKDQKRGRSRSLAPHQGSRQQREQAKRIWDWCQAEGGAYFSYSQNEILQMLMTSNVMPPDLARLIGKRDMAKRLVQRIQKSDSEGSLALLERDRSLAWIRDDDTGGYPLHVAAWKGLENVVAKIIEQPTTLEQRDRQRKTPLQIARRRSQHAIVDLLLQAGAVDPNYPPAIEKLVRMYQDPVLKDGEDYKEMRRAWNEPVPQPGPDPNEEGDDSDRQEPRATGGTDTGTDVPGLKPDGATEKETCPAQPAKRLSSPALEEARTEWSGGEAAQLTKASSTEAMSDSNSETAELRGESVMDGLRVSPRPDINKAEDTASAKSSVEQTGVPVSDAATEGNKISDYERAQVTSAPKETSTGLTLAPENLAKKPGAKSKVAEDEPQSGSKQHQLPRSLSPAKKQLVPAQGTAEDTKIDQSRSQLAEALGTQQRQTAGINELEPKAESHESQPPQPVNPPSASLQAQTKPLTEQNLVEHVEKQLAAVGKKSSVSEGPPTEAPVLPELKLFQQGREVDVLHLLQQQPEVRVTVGGQTLWIYRDDVAECRSKLQRLADALRGAAAAVNSAATFCQGQLTIPPASAESTEPPSAMGSLAPGNNPELHALSSSSDIIAKPDQ